MPKKETKRRSKKIAALNEALNITDEIISNKTPENKEMRTFEALPENEVKHKKEIEEDYVLVRATLRSLLGQGEIALGEVIALVTESSQPRFIEITGGLIRNISDVGKSLIDLHKEKQNLDNPKTKAQPKSQKNIANTPPLQAPGEVNYYIGTTTEMAEEMAKKEKKSKK